MNDIDGWVSVYRVADETEAQLVVGLLARKGIEAQVYDRETGLPGLTTATPQVLVPKELQKEAEEVIREYEESLLERAERPDWKCPKCGEMVPGAYTECYFCAAEENNDTESLAGQAEDGGGAEENE